LPVEDFERLDILVTPRDWFRYAVSRFRAAGLVFGHGTDNAVDEAAFLILEALHLPIEALDPFADAKLLRDERRRLAELVDARVETRKPAAYLLNRAYIQGVPFYVDERVIVPRSFIGELLVDDYLSTLVSDRFAVRRVLDLCTGSGCLAILAAEAFPEALIHASDISDDALAVAERNIRDYGLLDRIKTFKSDVFEGLPEAPYDLIISNPPYVTEAAVAAFPPEYRAEPRLAHAGGSDGLDIVRTILEGAAERLAPKGQLIVEVGSGQKALEASRPDLPFLWLDTEASKDEVFALLASDFRRAAAPKMPERRKNPSRS
jgi:ribosomal protein L3 glutamine methyltransferase